MDEVLLEVFFFPSLSAFGAIHGTEIAGAYSSLFVVITEDPPTEKKWREGGSVYISTYKVKVVVKITSHKPSRGKTLVSNVTKNNTNFGQ